MRICTLLLFLILFQCTFGLNGKAKKDSVSFEYTNTNTGIFSFVSVGFTSNQLHLSPYFSLKAHSIFAGITRWEPKEPRNQESKYDRQKNGSSESIENPTFNVGYRWTPIISKNFCTYLTLMYSEIEYTYRESSREPYATKIRPAFSFSIGLSHLFEHGSFYYGLGFSAGEFVGDVYLQLGFSINIFKLKEIE